MKPEDLLAIRYAVCAIGWIGTSSDKYYADPTRGKFEIEGTGFLIESRVIQTCDHVVEALERQRKRRRGKPFGSVAQFFYPDAAHSDEWTTAVRPFETVHLRVAWTSRSYDSRIAWTSRPSRWPHTSTFRWSVRELGSAATRTDRPS